MNWLITNDRKQWIRVLLISAVFVVFVVLCSNLLTPVSGQGGQSGTSNDDTSAAESLLACFFACGFPLIVIFATIWVYNDADKRGKDGILWALITFFTIGFGAIIWYYVRPEHPIGYQRNYPQSGYGYSPPHRAHGAQPDRQRVVTPPPPGPQYIDPNTLTAQSNYNPSPYDTNVMLQQGIIQSESVMYAQMSKKQLMEECRKKDISLDGLKIKKPLLIQKLMAYNIKNLEEEMKYNAEEQARSQLAEKHPPPPPPQEEDLRDTQFPPLPPPKEDGMWICPGCNSKIDDLYDYCTQCGFRKDS